ncbi:hypothetical protein JXB01_01400 [Candidatus Micrarchaeota archaeon]|nr:hypothetical protein [Candidatus Micrarchaeota archaeon]
MENGKKKKCSKKGQAAMEYLMTYGWAILVIVIVLAALYFWLPKGSEVCLFREPGFLCEGKPQIYMDEGQLNIAVRIDNKLSESIESAALVCTDAPEGDINSNFITIHGTATDGSWGAGSSKVFGGDTDLAIPCVDRNGDEIAMQENEFFKGYIAVAYSLSSDPNKNIKHVTLASVSGPVLATGE